MAGVHGLQKVEGLSATHFADDDPFITSITITEQMALRPRISDTIACSGC